MAIAIEPSEPIPHANLGSILLHSGRLDEAAEEFRTVLRLRPDFPRGRVTLAVVLFRQGRLPEAEIELREAVRRSPDDPVALVALGEVLLAEDRPADAVPPLEAALAVQPASTDAHDGLARAYTKLGRADLAAEHRRRASAPSSP